jgi:hypothetical protein
MKSLQPVMHIWWPDGSIDGKEEIENIKISTTAQANFGFKDGSFWYYTQHDDLIIVHPSQVKKIRVSHKQVK